MRKDVKLGLAIGGVLLAMAIVFAVFSSHPKTDVAVDDQVETPDNVQPTAGAVDAKSPDITAPKVDVAKPEPKPADVKPAEPKPVVAATVNPPVSDTKNIVDVVKPSDTKTSETDTKTAGTAKTAEPIAGAEMPKKSTDSAMFATTETPTGNDPHAAYGGGAFNTTDWDKTLATGVPKMVATEATPVTNTTSTVSVAHPIVQPATVITPNAQGNGTVVTEPAHRQQSVDADDVVSNSTSAAAASPVSSEKTAVSTTALHSETKHIVRSGETFSTIAAAAYGNAKYYKLIAAANPGTDSSHLKLGQTLLIPARTTAAAPAQASVAIEPTIDASRQYRVQSGDSLHKICMKLYGDSSKVDDLYDANKTKIGSDPAKLKLGMILTLPATPTAKAAS